MPTGLALLIAALALATWAHFFYWRRRLALRPDVDQILYARTPDGWRIALARRRPRRSPRRPAVLLCHGLAANRHAMDFAAPGHSLALALADRGFDCFSIDLRGHGLSTPSREARLAWTLDDYLRADLPAALDLIREETGSAEVLFVGHSQGALLGLAAAALMPERIVGVVAIAPPGRFGTTPAIRHLVRLGGLGLAGLLRPLARLWAPFGPIWHPRLAELALRRANVEPEVYRLFLANGAESVNPGVLAHFAQLVEEDRFRSFDRTVDYGAAFAQASRPALFISGERDGLAPPRAVEEHCVRWGGPKRYWSAGPAYGHGDLLIGRRAASEVHPVIAAWLEERSAPAPAAAIPR